MKPIAQMSRLELAAFGQEYLRQHGLEAVLSGGSAVMLYTQGQYGSRDVDLIVLSLARRRNSRQRTNDIIKPSPIRSITMPPYVRTQCPRCQHTFSVDLAQLQKDSVVVYRKEAGHTVEYREYKVRCPQCGHEFKMRVPPASP